MRYDQAVYLQSITEGAYDSTTGNYAADTVAETKVYANVQESTTERMRQEMGGIYERTITVTFQRIKYGWKRLRYNGKVYIPVADTCGRVVTLKEKP